MRWVPVAAERADHPVAHHLQQHKKQKQRPADRRARRDQEEDRRDPGKVGNGDNRIVAPASLERSFGEQRVCVSLRMQFLHAALQEHEKRGNLGRPHGRSEHVQPLAAGRFEPGASANRVRVAAPCGDSTGTKTRRDARLATGRP